MSQPNLEQVKKYLLQLQNNICNELAAEDGKEKFQEDNWERLQGGGGKTRVFENGAVIEKGGVNFSHVYGDELPAAILQTQKLLGYSYHAMGVSSVIHPHNPYAPTTHINVRFFLAEKKGAEPIWWFGGGFDLTPYYGFAEDCVHWHQTAKAACEPFGSEVYEKYKKDCDEYFFLKHRNEPRGIGGLFFDYINAWGFEKSFAFIRSVGDHFIKAYRPILAKRKNIAYGKREKDFQLYRRGRYVEFNLIYDRGTLFGLQTGGRTESILMSLPPEVVWRYDWQPEPGSPEDQLYKEFLMPKEWL